MNPDRRSLQFASLDEIMPEVDRLSQGNKTVGHWTFGQICDHLATVNRALADAPAEPKPDPSLRVSDEMKQEVFATGLLAENMPMPGDLTTPDDVEPTEAVNRLRAATAHYQASPGPVMDHPFYGPLSKEEWDQVIRIHSAHHLSFAIPQGD